MSGPGSKAEFMPQEKPSFCEDEKEDWKKQRQGAIPQPLQRLRTAVGCVLEAEVTECSDRMDAG